MSVRKMSIVLVAVALVWGLSGVALADTVHVSKGNPVGFDGGGEFLLNGIKGKLPRDYGLTSFSSFCLERNEPVKDGNRYHYVISTSTSTGDELDFQTAYLYSNFWNGTLENYNLGSSSPTKTSADNLQDAIWYFEGEKGLTDGAKFYVDLANDAVNNHGFSGLHGVRVLRLTTYVYHRAAQDMLVRIIPVPGAIWLGMGLVGCIGLVGGVRRRFQAK